MKTQTLLDIADDVVTLDDLLDEHEGDITGQEDAVAAFLFENDRALNEKVDGYAGLIKELEARAAARKAEADRIKELAKLDENRAKWLKERLLYAFDEMAITRVETPRFRVSTAKNGGKIPVVLDETATVATLPEAFVRTKVKREPDLDAMREAIEGGADIPGVRLGERGRGIRIK